MPVDHFCSITPPNNHKSHWSFGGPFLPSTPHWDTTLGSVGRFWWDMYAHHRFAICIGVQECESESCVNGDCERWSSDGIKEITIVEYESL